MTRSSAATWTGIAAGLAIFAHAMVQNSHGWPLVWAFAAGLVTIALSRGEEGGAGAALRAGAMAGAIAAAVAVAATLIALLVLNFPQEAARELKGREGALLIAMAIVAAITIVMASVGALTGRLMFGRDR